MPNVVTARLEYSGPFFTRNPVRTFRENVREFMDEVAAWGEVDIKKRIAGVGPHGIQTGETRKAYVGRTKSISGKRWATTAVVSPVYGGPKGRQRLLVQGIRGGRFRIRLANDQAVGAISLMAAASEIEGRHHFMSETVRSMRRFKNKMQTDLMKGIA